MGLVYAPLMLINRSGRSFPNPNSGIHPGMGVRVQRGNCVVHGGTVVLHGDGNITIPTDRGSADDCFVHHRLHCLARHFEASELPTVLNRLNLSMMKNASATKTSAFLVGSRSLNSLHQIA
jgi:hypothetical protein